MSQPLRLSPTPQTLTIPAVDGFPLAAYLWTTTQTDHLPPNNPIAIINPATSVQCRYYQRFATFLCEHGFNVITYDYRGIGGSRPEKMRGFKANWFDWGAKDFEGVLRFVRHTFANHPIQVVGHSVGGFLLGMAASNCHIQRVFTMGAQFAYWPDYAKHKRLGMYWRWHVLMPILTAIYGYFPGKALGWLEDTPSGVVADWIAPHTDIASMYRLGRQALSPQAHAEFLTNFSRLSGATLALSVSDDEFGTIPAIHRLLQCYKNSAVTHLRLEPSTLGLESIGHFAFFHARFADSLWRIPLAWLRDGTVTQDFPAQHIVGSPQ